MKTTEEENKKRKTMPLSMCVWCSTSCVMKSWAGEMPVHARDTWRIFTFIPLERNRVHSLECAASADKNRRTNDRRRQSTVNLMIRQTDRQTSWLTDRWLIPMHRPSPPPPNKSNTNRLRFRTTKLNDLHTKWTKWMEWMNLIAKSMCYAQ